MEGKKKKKEGALVSEVRHSCGFIKAIHAQLYVMFYLTTIQSSLKKPFLYFEINPLQLSNESLLRNILRVNVLAVH